MDKKIEAVASEQPKAAVLNDRLGATTAKTTPGARVPCLASQTDMLAEDWTIAASMPCGAIVTNVYEAYDAGVKAERERCARIAWESGGNKCDSLVEGITRGSLSDWLADRLT